MSEGTIFANGIAHKGKYVKTSGSSFFSEITVKTNDILHKFSGSCHWYDDDYHPDTTISIAANSGYNVSGDFIKEITTEDGEEVHYLAPSLKKWVPIAIYRVYTGTNSCAVAAVNAFQVRQFGSVALSMTNFTASKVTATEASNKTLILNVLYARRELCEGFPDAPTD